MTRRLRAAVLPAPLLSALLFAAWLMLNASLSAGHLVLAAVLAVAIPLITERLRPDKAVVRRWDPAIRLAAVVLADIVRCNVELAWRIVGPATASRPGFFWLPLDIRDRHGIVVLASIITMTPGTLSAELGPDQRHLLIHAFDLADEAALVADIKTRYEAPLRRIFE